MKPDWKLLCLGLKEHYIQEEHPVLKSYHLTNNKYQSYCSIQSVLCVKTQNVSQISINICARHISPGNTRTDYNKSLCVVYTSIFKTNFGLFLFSSCTFCQQLKGKVCHSWWWLTKGTWWKDWIQWLEESQKQRHLAQAFSSLATFRLQPF